MDLGGKFRPNLELFNVKFLKYHVAPPPLKITGSAPSGCS